MHHNEATSGNVTVMPPAHDDALSPIRENCPNSGRLLADLMPWVVAAAVTVGGIVILSMLAVVEFGP